MHNSTIYKACKISIKDGNPVAKAYPLWKDYDVQGKTTVRNGKKTCKYCINQSSQIIITQNQRNYNILTSTFIITQRKEFSMIRKKQYKLDHRNIFPG